MTPAAASSANGESIALHLPTAGNGSISPASVIPWGCRPSRIASTISDAGSISLTRVTLNPASALEGRHGLPGGMAARLAPAEQVIAGAIAGRGP